jgi:hypothetical protein
MGGKVAQNAGKVKGLTGIQKALLVKYALYADDSNPTKSVFPSQATLIEEMGFGKTAIKEAKKVLIKNGLLVLVKASCHKTKKSSEYLLSPTLFTPTVNIKCAKLPTGSVYNPVDNSVDKTNTGSPHDPNRVATRPYSGSPHGPQSSSSSSIEVNHMIGGQQDDFLEKDVNVKMQELGIFEHERRLLISQYGTQTINLELRDLSGRRGIEKKGPYLRKVLEQKYGRLIRYRRAVGY